MHKSGGDVASEHVGAKQILAPGTWDGGPTISKGSPPRIIGPKPAASNMAISTAKPISAPLFCRKTTQNSRKREAIFYAIRGSSRR